MAYINALSKVLPDHPFGQDDLLALGRIVLKGRVPFLDRALKMLANAGVDQRFFVAPVQELLENDSLDERTRIYKENAIRMGEQLMVRLCESAGIQADEIDMIITTSCTGFMIPSVDAYLVNRFRMRKNIKRLPITELGCAAGAMALSRAHDYLKAYPDHKVVVLALEMPSLTYRTQDFRVANMVSAALFGDGGAAALLSNEAGPCRILDTRTHFYYDTPELMGFDLGTAGFKIILDKAIPNLIKKDFVKPVADFLTEQGLKLADLKHLVFHPGGRRILDTLIEVLQIEEEDVSASRRVLAEVGNLSSASVLWVLEETLKKEPQGLGLMAAFGPGFNAEMLALNFEPQKNG